MAQTKRKRRVPRDEAEQDRDRWQDQSDRYRRQYRDDIRRDARHSAVASQDAARTGVRALNELTGLLLPPAIFRPGEMLRSWFDFQAQIFNTQRAIVDEWVRGLQDGLRYASREAQRDEHVYEGVEGVDWVYVDEDGNEISSEDVEELAS